MTPLVGVLLGIYIAGLITQVVFGYVKRAYIYDPHYSFAYIHLKTKKWARIIVLAPVWPLVVVVLIIKEIYWLLEDAVS